MKVRAHGGDDSFSSHFAVHYASSAEQFLAIRVFPFTEVLIPRHQPGNLCHALPDSLPFADDGCGMWHVACGMWHVACGMWHGLALALACWSLGLFSQCWALLACHPVFRSVPACLPEGLCSNSIIFENTSEVVRDNSLLVSHIYTIYSLRNEDVIN